VLVVGVDGSEGSHRALLWAIEEAQARTAPLTVVHAWRYGAKREDPYGMEELGRAAQHLLDDEVAVAVRAGVDAGGELVFDRADRALARAAVDADLLVVGSRGRGRMSAALLGSVSMGCVRRAPCPVVIVPDRGLTVGPVD
jgi:nucleotide-binding universal stress UspA family protein